jgi:hypothetical protein
MRKLIKKFAKWLFFKFYSIDNSFIEMYYFNRERFIINYDYINVLVTYNDIVSFIFKEFQEINELIIVTNITYGITKIYLMGKWFIDRLHIEDELEEILRQLISANIIIEVINAPSPILYDKLFLVRDKN